MCQAPFLCYHVIMEETWKRIRPFSYYEVSNLGRVRSLKVSSVDEDGKRFWIQGKIISQYLSDGYPKVNLRTDNGSYKRRLVYRLVADAFLPERDFGQIICHNDGNKENNSVENLRWDTPKANAADHVAHGNHHESKKTHCKRLHPLEEPNLVPNQVLKGKRVCLACSRTNGMNYRAGYVHSEGYLQIHSDVIYDRIISGKD